MRLPPSLHFLHSRFLEDFSEWGDGSVAKHARKMCDILHRDARLPIVAREPQVGRFSELPLGLRTWYAHVDCPLPLRGFAPACGRIARGRLSLAAPFCIVLASSALLSFLGQQEWRYMGVMAMFLVLQLVIAHGYVGPAAQKQDRLASR